MLSFLIKKTMNTKEKLRQLHKSVQKKPVTKFVNNPVDYERTALELGGEVINLENGRFIRIIKKQKLSENYGTIKLNGVEKIPGATITILSKKKVDGHFSFHSALFIDTETTGLSGGSGTYAFLVGLGYFSDQHFVVEQLFMPGLNDEVSVLSYLENKLAEHSGLVSFNGKSYDIPLLTARFIQNRIRPSIDLHQNFDVLHASRRIWKNDFGDCTLITLENKLLNLARQGDVPGEEIPQIFMDYLQTNNTKQLKKVIYHNQMDIISMAAIIQILHQAIKQPEKSRMAVQPQEKRVAQLFKDNNEINPAIDRYKILIDSENISQEDKSDLLFDLGLLYKKTKRFQESEKVWLRQINEVEFSIRTAIELAKYYEHKEKNFLRASEFTNRSLDVLKIRQELGAVINPELHRALFKRRERLLKKIARTA
ncbi:MAG: hypothetical protein DWQ05_18435 [Calditrichaeota bacterium]|nr:MAG: hypothetical protein DWQ05_18435 [Calditrichota bacterium]